MSYHKCVSNKQNITSKIGTFNLPTAQGSIHIDLPFQPDKIVLNARNATYFWIFEYPTRLGVTVGTERVGLRLMNDYSITSMLSAVITPDANGFTFNAAGTALGTTDTIEYIAVKE